jgi:hypothetical protein
MSGGTVPGNGARWSEARAGDWYARQPWLVGCNFIPSTAVNQLEMWQAETFDATTINRELSWAADLGFNTMRVFLHDVLWDADAAGFGSRIDAYLAIAARHNIRTLFVLFDDCWHDGAKLGPQPAPVPGRHNSGWLQSPGRGVIASHSALPRLEEYVKGVVGAFAADDRVLGWDIYNEVTNGFLPAQSLPREERAAALDRATRRRLEQMPLHLELLDLAFGWARASRPSQPLTAGLFLPDRELNAHLVEQSDIVTFHCYENAERLTTLIGRLRRHNRPLICTEYMARTLGSDFRSTLPVFKRERVGCYNWGLVNGKTQTHIAWSGASDRWFHDILHADGRPYDAAEAEFIRAVTAG